MKDFDVQQFDRICETLHNALKGISAFQRRFFPLDASDLAETLRPLESSLMQAQEQIKKLADSNERIEYRIQIEDSIDTLLDILKTIKEALAMSPQESAIRVTGAYRKISYIQEKLYAIRSSSPYIDQIFLEPGVESVRIADPKKHTGARVGLYHYGTEENDYARGAFSLYVPETYNDTTEWPLIIALHGGSGHGRSFIWMWLREARSHGMILLAPTSLERTWSILEPEIDGDALYPILDFVDKHYNVDMNRILVTGFSDGGTFALMCALQEQTPFTAFAPISCVIPPFDIQFTKNRRIYWVHGRLDWMFPVRYAEEGCKALQEAEADVTLRLIEDLSHTYPREENIPILKWFDPNLSVQV